MKKERTLFEKYVLFFLSLLLIFISSSVVASSALSADITDLFVKKIILKDLNNNIITRDFSPDINIRYKVKFTVSDNPAKLFKVMVSGKAFSHYKPDGTNPEWIDTFDGPKRKNMELNGGETKSVQWDRKIPSDATPGQRAKVKFTLKVKEYNEVTGRWNLLGATTKGRTFNIVSEKADDIMLQTYHWGTINDVGNNFYQLMINEAQNIADDGFSIVWFPPCSDTADQVGYLPRRWYDVNRTQNAGQSRYGKSGAEVADAIAAFHNATPKVYVIADIVINHRIATNGYLGFTDPPMGGKEVVAYDGYNGIDYGGWGNDIRQADRHGTAGDGSYYDSGIDCEYAQDIVHENSDDSWTQTIIKSWMTWMKGGTSDQTPAYASTNGPGFDGWRYVMVKGFHGYYIKVYNDHTSPYFSVGEYWDYDTQPIYDWINETHTDNDKKSLAFDFPTKKLLTQIWNGWDGKNLTDLYSLGGNNLPGMLKWWPAKAVTFLDNHDTATPHDNPYEFNTSEKALVQGNAYILTHPGVPCVFWKHYYDSTDKVKTAIGTIANIRRNQGLHRESNVCINCRDLYCYMATIDDKVKIRIGSNTEHDPSSGWTVAYDGDSAGNFEVKVWTSSGSGRNNDTIVRIKKDVGYSNSLYLRGDTPPLSWDLDYEGTWTSDNWWEFNLCDMGATGTFEFKGYTSYGEWQSGPTNRIGNIAQTTEVAW